MTRAGLAFESATGGGHGRRWRGTKLPGEFVLPDNLKHLIIGKYVRRTLKRPAARRPDHLEKTSAQTRGSQTTLNREEFERLLDWLDQDRDIAGRYYEEIRCDLIERFRAHGCVSAEDLADVTINRVARKLREIQSVYEGDRRPYFYRVGYYVHLEHLRGKFNAVELADNIPARTPDDIEPEFACLERCLSYLPELNREIIETYYRGERRRKIELRKQLAVKLRIELPLLRVKARRIRQTLKRCIVDCLDTAEGPRSAQRP